MSMWQCSEAAMNSLANEVLWDLRMFANDDENNNELTSGCAVGVVVEREATT